MRASRLITPLATAGVVLAVAATSALPASAVPLGLPGASGASAVAGGSWSTSFEADQEQPLDSTAEMDARGPRQQNITGGQAADGSLLGAVSSIAASAENAPGEVAANLADSNPDTKWLAFEPTGWVTYGMTTPQRALRYSLTSGNDAPERDPVDIVVEGSTDGTTWSTVDTQSGLAFASRGLTKTFTIASPAAYSTYRLTVAKNAGANIVQLADWGLFDDNVGPAPIQPMVTSAGSGPRSGYNIKSQVGWTGVQALRYAGTHTGPGRAFGWNQLFSVNVPVGDASQLSYKIFPEMVSGDLSYPSTFAAIDLHFTDGTYLSDLKAVDAYGTATSPNGQGLGKILYASQWNSVTVELGDVARGKTIDRILFGYDNTTGVADTRFGGYVDDVAIVATPASIDRTSPTNAVDTRRGTNASGSFSRGNNLPISAVPNGFTFFTPLTDANSQSWQYSYQAGNNADNLPMMQGIGISHEPSPWMGDRNQLSVMPSITQGSAPTGNADDRALAFDHATEIARPDQYRAYLEGGIVAEVTPADHGGIYRFTFPDEAPTGSLVLDTVDNNGAFTIDPASGTVTGWVDNGSGLSVGRSRMFVYGTFDQPVTLTGVAPDGHTGTRFATFDTGAAHQVELRLATSFLGLDQAKHNHALELAGRSFDQVQGAAKAAWDERLSVVEVEGANDTALRTLYSNLYRLNLYPNSQSENVGTADAPVWKYASPVQPKSGAATATTTNAVIKTGQIYVNNGFWDTYRTVWPAYSLLYPEMAAKLADGFVQQYRDGGWVARWSSPGYADLMTGTSSDVAFADAYLKGVKLPDPAGAYAAALKNATVQADKSGVGRKGLDTSIFLGYTPSSTHESVSWGLEGLINDFGIGNQAAKLAQDPSLSPTEQQRLREESEYFLERATSYGNLLNPATGFFQGRAADGSYAADFDPESWGGDFTETNGWNFAFHAPQDGTGLAGLLGGTTELAKKLDTFFATPETATKPGGYGGTIHEMVEARDVRMGQFGMSNQVSHHVPYMYNWAGQQYKTAEKVREVLRRLSVGGDIGQGYPGDEDNGEMSSWFTLSSLGLYPLQVGSDQWAVGSPKFTKATVHRASGDLVITAPDNSETNIYVQKVKVDGDGFKDVSIPQSKIAGPTTIEFTMGPRPSDYGTKPNAAPPSLTKAGEKPTPLHDVTGAGRGTVTAPGASSAAALFDNKASSTATFPAGPASITYALSGLGQRATFYTLTNATTGGDPTAWRVEGSNDGTRWTTVDTRTAQSWPWRAQTRPFKVARPGTFSTYRIVVTATSGGALSLGEVEFLSDGSKAAKSALTLTPGAALETVQGVAVSGTLATFAGGKGKTGADGATATIDWGDGTRSAGTVTLDDLGTGSVTGTHTYADPGFAQPTVTVTQGKESASVFAGVTVHQAVVPAYATGFDLRCIGDPGEQVVCDGDRAGVSRPALTRAGVTPGRLLAVPGTDLHWSLPAVPVGQPDNATGAGQTMPVTLAPGATQLSLIGTATQKSQDTVGTVTFDDGSTMPYPIQYGDWCGPALFGNSIAVQMDSRLNGTGTDSCPLKFFATAPLTIPVGRTVVSVTLPTQTGDPHANGRIHIFAVADNGTPITFTPAAAATATVGASASLTLGSIAGGVPNPGGYMARVQWGDGSATQDAAVQVGAGGKVTVSGTHTYVARGTYVVRVLVGDSRSDVLGQVSVTVN